MNWVSRAGRRGIAASGLRGTGSTLVLLIGGVALFPATAGCETPKPEVEPRVFSVYPLGDRPGAVYEAVVLGVTLRETQAIWFESDLVHARVDRAERDSDSDPKASTPTDRVKIRVSIDAHAKPGSYPFRVVTARGVSNAISLRITKEPAMIEHDSGNSDPERAPRLSGFPVVVNGRVAQRGEVDYYCFDARPGEEFSFEAISGFSAFDPSIAILEPSGSWFDSHRLNRIAFNDEPLYHPDFSTDAKLVHRFDRGGRFLLAVAAFQGEGSPNDVYQVRVTKDRESPTSLRPRDKPGWQEHSFARALAADRLDLLRRRGAAAADATQAFETFGAVSEPAQSPPVMKIPGIVEGLISKPGEVQTIALQVKGPQDLVLEMETPDTTLPLFNPVVRVLDSSGAEVVTNVYTQLNNCGGYMMKAIEPKVIASFRADGEYRLQMHDITTDKAGERFRYRLLIRSKIPHLGKVAVEQERINIAPGTAKELIVNIEREEDYAGLVAFGVEGLPPGVQAVTGSEPDEEKPPAMNAGKVERYFPKTQKAVLLITATPEAPLTPMPRMARVVVRPVVDGKPGQAVATEPLPVMVVRNTSDGGANVPSASGTR
jgi:hypothetical protein